MNNHGWKHKVIRLGLDWIIPIVLGLVVALICEKFWLTTANVDGNSMQPNLENNERVMVWRRAKIKRLSVIVFDAYGISPDANTPNTDYVKRVIGMPGDTVSFQNNHLYVNGKVLNQNFISKVQQSDSGTGYINTISPQPLARWNIPALAVHWDKNTTALKVPKNEYFVLGDHRSVSFDSRYWGFVPKAKILGVVKTFAWSTNNQKRHNINALAN